MNAQPKTKPIPVRVDADTRARTDRAAKQLGITRAGIIKIALRSKLVEIESGRLNIPR